MSTLLISENFPPVLGGTSRWFWDLYSRLPRELTIVAAGATPGHAGFDATHTVAVHRVPLSFEQRGFLDRGARSAYRRATSQVSEIARRGRVGRIHAARAVPEGWVALRCRRRLGLPFACSVHGEELAYARASRQLELMTRRVLRAAAVVIATSHSTAAALVRGWRVSAERIEVVHPGVDTDAFQPAPPDPVTRDRLGWSQRPVLLTVSRLQKRKGHDVMVEAVGAIRRIRPDVLWAVVGDGEERPEIEAEVRRLDLGEHTLLHGDLDERDLLSAYQQCDVFVLPGRDLGEESEGFGIVLLEAQACGRPVVVGRSGGTPEAVDHGRTARVVDCSTPDPLSEALIELLGAPALRRRMGDTGRQWAVERFGADRSRDRLLQVLDERCPVVGRV